jgi:Uma2 family endonuclease
MTSLAHQLLTWREYLDIERRAETKSEFFNSEMVAMSSATRRHNLLTVSLAVLVSMRLEGQPCEVYANDMRVRVPEANTYTYPDLVVACDGPRFEDEIEDTLLNSSLIFEVLSRSTAGYDRGDKFACCRKLESLVDYVLLAQDRPRIEHFARQPDGSWLLTALAGPDDILRLTSVGVEMTVAEIYARVDLVHPAHPRGGPNDAEHKR